LRADWRAHGRHPDRTRLNGARYEKTFFNSKILKLKE
jgi:hypothetical protein